MTEEGNNQTTHPVNTPTPPVAPVTPAEPTTPVAPVEPTTPTTPVVPATPTTPTTPVVPPTAPPATPPVEPVNVEKITADIEKTVTGKVQKSVLEKISDLFKLDKKEEKALPTDPAELKKFIQETAKEQAQEILKARDDKTAETATERQRQLNVGAEGFKTVWARDYTEMSNMNMVPKIEKPEDENDPGNVVKTRILTKLGEILKENEDKGVDHVPSLWEIVQRFPDVLKGNVVPGANAPVSGGGKTVGSGDPTYDKMHNTPIETMVAQKAEKIV